MKQITKIMTFDGATHDCRKDAQRYLDKLHGDQLSKIAHSLVQHQKYTEIGNWVDANLHMFIHLNLIKEDMVLESTDD